jgi:hypothetical protein
MDCSYGLSLLFAPGDRHVILGTKVSTEAAVAGGAESLRQDADVRADLKHDRLHAA